MSVEHTPEQLITEEWRTRATFLHAEHLEVAMLLYTTLARLFDVLARHRQDRQLHQAMALIQTALHEIAMAVGEPYAAKVASINAAITGTPVESLPWEDSTENTAQRFEYMLEGLPMLALAAKLVLHMPPGGTDGASENKAK